jgi:hypothetical protein
VNGVLWGWVALAAGLVAGWLFERRARRSERMDRADIRKVNDERYRHAGSMDPFMGAGSGSYAPVEDAARADARRAAEAERLARDPDDRR